MKSFPNAKKKREQYFHGLGAHHCLWNVTRMGLPCSPIAIPDVASLALIAPASVSYSMKAIPARPGTVRTSWNPSKRPKTASRPSWVTSAASSRTKRILFGGRYSSGMTAAAAPELGLRPAPLVVFAGRAASIGTAGRLSFFWASRASWACFRSVEKAQSASPSSFGRGIHRESREHPPHTFLR